MCQWLRNYRELRSVKSRSSESKSFPVLTCFSLIAPPQVLRNAKVPKLSVSSCITQRLWWGRVACLVRCWLRSGSPSGVRALLFGRERRSFGCARDWRYGIAFASHLGSSASHIYHIGAGLKFCDTCHFSRL